MGKWVIAILGMVAVMGLLLWQLEGGGPAKIQIPTYDAGPTVALLASDARPLKVPKTRSDARASGSGEPEVAQFDPQSEEFSREVDVGIPDGFRARLARCERKGVDPDAQITSNYRLHIESGVISASQVSVGKSDLGNSELEQCMVGAVQQARWEAADMPDFMEDQELFIRIRSLNKYLERGEQENAKSADRKRSGP